MMLTNPPPTTAQNQAFLLFSVIDHAMRTNRIRSEVPLNKRKLAEDGQLHHHHDDQNGNTDQVGHELLDAVDGINGLISTGRKLVITRTARKFARLADGCTVCRLK